MVSQNSKKVARLEVRLSPDVKEEFASHCNAQGVTASDAIRDFVYQTLHGEQRGVRQLKVLLAFMGFATLCALFIFALPTSHSASQSADVISLVKQEQPWLKFEFQVMDNNRDGFITVDDIERRKQRVIRAIEAGRGPVHGISSRKKGQRMTVEEYSRTIHPRYMVNRRDDNEDGRVSFDEYKLYPVYSGLIRWGRFDEVDQNKDQIITLSELIQYAEYWFNGKSGAKKRAQNLSKSLLAMRDLNRDGELTVEEYP